MNLSLYSKTKNEVSVKFSLCLPHIFYSKITQCDFGPNYVTSEISMNTGITVRSSGSLFYFKIRLLGFGFKGSIQDVRKC